MLELAQKLADNDKKFFGGWVLAGVEVHIHGRAAALANNTLLQKERRCILQVLGTAADGSIAKDLRVFLVLPRTELQAAKAAADFKQPQGLLLAEHCFTVQEVRAYVAYTGDKNIIHEGEHPIVPGLCMAAWLQSALRLQELDWKVSFTAPVFTGDCLRVYRTDRGLQAYVGANNVFNIKL